MPYKSKDEQNNWHRNWYYKNKKEISKKRKGIYNEYYRKYKKKEVNKIKIKAQTAIYRALKRGEIKKPSKCEQCKRVIRLLGHHEYYDKPLDVIWLCGSCHKNLHNLYDINRTTIQNLGNTKKGFFRKRDKWKDNTCISRN